MGLFSNKNDDGTKQRNPDAVFGFRALAAGYVLYLVYQTVDLYLKGEASVGIWLPVVSAVVLGGGAIFILVSSFISWRKEKAELAKAEEETPEETEASEENSEE